ncbi:MAG: ABC transporter permease [Candidatus Omnitrophica bacterium]|nr:ABC transporter permease [Candidatus Omnitrophota bacterium]
MHYENWISYRYLKAKQGGFLRFLHFISVAGVATGVMALIVVISVMTGFGNTLRERIIGTSPHITVEKETGLTDYQDLREQLLRIPEVKSATAYLQGNIYLESHGQSMALILRGDQVQSQAQTTRMAEFLKKGNVDELKNGRIFIGTELARFFGFDIGDLVTLISPGTGISGEGWRHSVEIAGIFETGMSDLDQSLIVSNIATAQKLFNIKDDRVHGIGVQLQDPYKADEIKKKVYARFGFKYAVKTWTDTNRGLFQALKLEKLGLFLVLTLMVLVASFNIISTLIVTVTSKVHDIGVLQSIGVSKASIRRIFTRQGIYIGLRGIMWGVVLGLSICYILKTYVEVPQSVYGVDRVPVEVELFDMLWIIGCAFVISYLASIYPSSKAASLEPVDALRYE